MKWHDFVYHGENYDLSHLHPFDFDCSAPVNAEKQWHYHINATFGLHTFTHQVNNGKNLGMYKELLYQDSREEREFDFERYKLSKRLPDIVKSIDHRKCYHTGHDNFFTIEIVEANNNKQDYEVYFKLSKCGNCRKKGWLNLHVISAYVRDNFHEHDQPRKRPIRFHVLAYNVLKQKPIRPGK